MVERDSTKLEHLRRIRKVLFYIEQHLLEELSLEQLAKVGCFSLYHFHRIFHSAVGEAPGAYIRRLRMERAANHLAFSDDRITDLALDASYDTPSAFSKAFKNVMGCSPTQYRERTPGISKQENFAMKPTIQYFDELPVLAARKTGCYSTAVPAAWDAVKSFAKTRGFFNKDTRFIAIYHDNPEVTAEENIRCDACCTAPAGIEEGGELVRRSIPAGRYASFRHEGPLDEIDKTFDGIFGGWYPESGEQLGEHPCLVELVNYSEVESLLDAAAIIHLPLARKS